MNDRDIYRQQNFGNRIGFGRRSALLIVDFTVGFNDPRLFGGGNIDAAVQRTVPLLGFFRQQSLPVAFTARWGRMKRTCSTWARNTRISSSATRSLPH